MGEHFRITCGEIDYTEFDFDEFQNVIHVLASTRQMVCAFEAVLHWAKSDDDTSQIDTLLSMIDFEAIKNTYLKESVLTQTLILERADLYDTISKLAADQKFLIIAGLDSCKSVIKYSPSTGETQPCSLPPFRCESSAVAACQNKVVVAGGTGSSMSKIQIYDPEDDSWTVSETTLKIPRYGAKAVTIQNKVYIVGGHDGQSALSSIEILEQIHGSFEQSDASKIPSLQTARSNHTLTVRNDEIYVVGGSSTSSFNTSQERLSSCEVINTSTNERYDIPSLFEARSSHSAVINDDSLIVTSGLGEQGFNNRLKSAEAYSFATKTWSKLPPLLKERSGHSSFVFNENVHVIGGTFPNTVERCDSTPSTMWSRLLNFAGYSQLSWKSHQELSAPSYPSTVIPL